MRSAIVAAITAALLPAGLAEAREVAVLKRIEAGNVELITNGFAPAEIWLSDDQVIDASDRRIGGRGPSGTITVPLSADTRSYVLLKGNDGAVHVVAERVLPLEQASNFRDIGGYTTKDGRTVRWGVAYRSGAMPLLTEADYALVDQLDLDSVVDLRSMDERQISADEIDDRTGALFLANDYGMKTLMDGIRADGENMYRGMEKLLAPQYRALFKRLAAGEGAVLYHCSAGQDRTGVATALIYDILGVDRETILKDYHLSTQLRRLQWEMPQIDPKDYPGNFMVQFYASSAMKERKEAQPLYTASGASHLAQFFAYLDKEYGGTEAYTKQVLGLQDADIARLRTVMLR